MEVLGVADNPFEAVKFIKKQIPDVITLDINMPKMDGITFLKKIMSQHPIPVLMVSTLINDNDNLIVEALQIGAADVIKKPHTIGNKREEFEMFFRDKILSVSKIRLNKHKAIINKIPKKLSADVIIPKLKRKKANLSSQQVIAIGASTGGTTALMRLLSGINTDMPAIIVAQHMPESFTLSFAERLDQLCWLNVKEAEDGEELKRNNVYIAPGNKHVYIRSFGEKKYIVARKGPLVNRHRPAVDVLFRAVASEIGANAIGVLLTGMGDDGARGLLEIKDAGGYTIAQDESSSVVFGMPKVAIELNAANIVLPLEQMPDYIVNRVKKMSYHG